MDRKIARHPIVVWGMIGILVLVLRAVYRLSFMAFELVGGQPLNAVQWVLLVVWVFFMVYAEGYRGFHKAFSPRGVLRLCVLAERPTLGWGILAPFVGMGLLRATRKRLIVSWCLIIGIVFLVMFVSTLGYPYRSIVDLGVVFGLLIGAISLTIHYVRALQGQFPDMPSDMT